jgi:type III restriction enzyme
LIGRCHAAEGVGERVTQGPIENPIINSPFVEPTKHLLTSADGEVTGEIDGRRRPSEFFVPVARPKKLSGQLTLDAFGGPKKQQPNEIVNEIRQSVARWRASSYPHFTSTTRDLLDHWRDEDRERRLFFCQLEAAEAAIYLTEAAERLGDTKAMNVIRQENAAHNGGLPRFAFKMATGSGKTVLMAMLTFGAVTRSAVHIAPRRAAYGVMTRHGVARL